MRPQERVGCFDSLIEPTSCEVSVVKSASAHPTLPNDTSARDLPSRLIRVCVKDLRAHFGIADIVLSKRILDCFSSNGRSGDPPLVFPNPTPIRANFESLEAKKEPSGSTAVQLHTVTEVELEGVRFVLSDDCDTILGAPGETRLSSVVALEKTSTALVAASLGGTRVLLNDNVDGHSGQQTRICVRNATIEDMLVSSKASPFRCIVASTLSLKEIQSACDVFSLDIKTAKTGWILLSALFS